jgi:hypothetical protein
MTLVSTLPSPDYTLTDNVIEEKGIEITLPIETQKTGW